MTDLRDAARQALNSLRGYRREISCGQPCDAEQALVAALKQPEQEPVGRFTQFNGEWKESPTGVPLFFHPPRREWRGLSEQERHRLWRKLCEGEGLDEYAEAIEAALKERNV